MTRTPTQRDLFGIKAEDQAITDRTRVRFEKMRAAREAKWAATTDEQLLRMRIEASAKDTDATTMMCLGLAVPMWIDRMRYWRPAHREQVAHELGERVAYDQSIAAVVDPDARGTVKKGEIGSAFNAIAQGLACLAFCPGGVVFAGYHWEVEA
jgi:hypothetical protein